jgi:hypothetical protein
MSFRLPINEPVHIVAKFADVHPGAYGASVKLKGLVDGAAGIEHVYLPGAAADVLTQLHAAGIIAEIPHRLPGDGEPPVPLMLTTRDITLELTRANAKAPLRLTVACTPRGATAPLPAPAPPASARVAQRANGKSAGSLRADAAHAEPPSAHAMQPEDPRARCQARRRAVTRAFREAMETAGTELLPIFAAHDIAIDGETFFKLSFSLFSAWRESGGR